MTRMPSLRHAAPLAAALALAVGVAAIATSGGGPAARPAPTTTTPPPAEPPDTAAGAVMAATAFLERAGQAVFGGTWSSADSDLTSGAFRASSARYVPAFSAWWRSHFAAAHLPYATRYWPLGYAVEHYSATEARMRVWQLFVLAVSGRAEDTEFLTFTVSLSWIGGGWKVTAMPSGPDLAPPGQSATPSQVTSWIEAADQYHGYHYVP